MANRMTSAGAGSWPQPRRFFQAMAAAGLVAAAMIGVRAAPVASPSTQAPSPDLTIAHRWLERLAAAAAIDQPITLVLRTGPAAPCPPAFRSAAGTGSPAIEAATTGRPSDRQPSGPSLACLRSRSLSSPMGGGFFVPFVMALQQQSDPFAADPPAALAVAGRTLLLHLPTNPRTLLPATSQARPGATRPATAEHQTSAPEEGVEPDVAACLLARELAALLLDQPSQRVQAFEGIHNGLAAAIAAASKGARNAQSTKEFGLFLLSPLQMMLSKATSPNRANPLNQELQDSPHWLVLSRQAPGVAEAMGSFADLPEESLKKAWSNLDGAFAMAAQDRLEVVEKQQRAAQERALMLLADAGLDPRPCAALSPAAVAGARLAEAVATFERTRPDQAVATRSLPRRFLPDANTVVIFPAGTRAGAQPASR